MEFLQVTVIAKTILLIIYSYSSQIGKIMTDIFYGVFIDVS